MKQKERVQGVGDLRRNATLKFFVRNQEYQENSKGLENNAPSLM